MLDKQQNGQKQYGFALLCILVMYLLAISRAFISIGLNQPDFLAKYARVIYGAIAVFCLILFVYQAIKTKKISLTEAGAICLIIYILLNIYITSAVHGEMSEQANASLLEFGVKAIPAILLGCIAARKRALYSIINCIDYVMVFISLAMTRALILCISQTINRVMIGTTFGADYQQISYYAGYFFALNMFMIFVGRRHVTGRIRSSAAFQVVRVVELLIFTALSLYSGGRGGFILILVTLVYWIFYYAIRTKKYKLLIGGVVLLAFLFYVFFYDVLGGTVFSNGYLRIFEFIGKDSINWTGTSGRQEVYARVFNLINQSPLVGNGITGGSYYQTASAHNWILEILLEGGILYLALWCFILFRFFRKLRNGIRVDECYWLMATVFLTDFVGLMFSFIYLRCTAIWFAIFYILNDNYEIITEPPKTRETENLVRYG